MQVVCIAERAGNCRQGGTLAAPARRGRDKMGLGIRFVCLPL